MSSACSELVGRSKKDGGKRLRHRWLCMNSEGELREITMGKAAITHRLGVQARDLRLLDAQAGAAPPAMLVRDKAIVINLEFLKTIITTDYVIIQDSGENRVTAFVQEYRRRLRNTEVCNTGGKSHGAAALPVITEEVPFELRALEVVLDFITLFLQFLVTGLEKLAHPILDAVVQKVSLARLERLRGVKNRMVRLSTRIETIRDLLEKLLDDDEDMRNMNLSARVRNAVMNEWRIRGDAMPATPHVAGRGLSQLVHTSLAMFDKENELERDKDQVEQVLETYFMNLDNTYHRLQTLAEYVDDSEDYIKFDIDTQRNRFIEYRLVIQFFMVAAIMVANVANVFTINAGVPADPPGHNLPPTWRDAGPNFVIVTCVGTPGAVILLAVLLAYARYKRLLLW